MFEKGDTGQEELKRRVARDFGVEIQTGPKVPDPTVRYEIPILPLQAADFASWHIRRILDQQASQGSVPRNTVRWDFEELFTRVKVGDHHRHFAMTAGTPMESDKGFVRQSLGIPSLVKFCLEYGDVLPRQRK